MGFEQVPIIASTATALPPHHADRRQAKAVMCGALGLESKGGRLLAELIDASDIETRYSVIALDMLTAPRPLEETRAIFQRCAVELAAQAARRCMDEALVSPHDIDALITVSCTGLLLPSLGAHLATELRLRDDVVRLPITELGCAGGAAGLARAADLATARAGSTTLLVTVEVPSLNFQVADPSPTNLVASAIFGDGAAAAVIRSGGRSEHQDGIEILAAASHLEPNTTQSLRFDLAHDGFHAVLGRELPELVARNLPRLVRSLTARTGKTASWYVLHAGGKKLLRAVEQALDLKPCETAASWNVMRRYGNQSSASVLFGLDEHMRHHRPTPGSVGVLAAVGPGVAFELVLLSC